MESLILFLMVTICFIKADDNLAWKVVKKALQFGDDLHLFCQVKNCCQKSAGWGKWTSDDHLITIFIDVKNLHNDGSLKYSGGTNKTGFFLRIRNITQGDLNISYSCTYGFQVSRKKNLLMEDALFSPPKTIETINRFKGPPKTIETINRFKEKTDIIPDVSSIDSKQEFEKIPLIIICSVIGSVIMFIIVGIIFVKSRQKFLNTSYKAEREMSHQKCPASDTYDYVDTENDNCSNDSGIITPKGNTVSQSADRLEMIEQECPLIGISKHVHSPTENRSHDSGKIIETKAESDKQPYSGSRRRRNTNSCSLLH